MNDNQKIQQRVIQAAENVLSEEQYVNPIDLFIAMKLLQPVHVEDWRQGKTPFLEEAIQWNLHKISLAMKCFRDWAEEKKLKPHIMIYLAKTSSRKELRFSVSDDPEIEEAYRTYYVSPHLSALQEKKIHEKLNAPPEQVVFQIIQSSACSRCKKNLHKGNLLFMEAGEPLCLGCAHLDDLAFLSQGNATLTRRAKKNSKKHAVVVRFSRTRKRYERQGLLVEKDVLAKIKQELNLEDEDDE